MNKIKLAIYSIVMAFVIGASYFAVNSNNKFASASAADTCPNTGSGWIKIDGLSGLTYTYTPELGFMVTDNCMKVGSHAPIYGTGATVTNTSLFNSPGNLPQGQVCTAPRVPVSGCALQSISHAAFKVVVISTPTPTVSVTPTITPTITPTVTPTIHVTPTVSPTPTYEPSVTPTITPEPTPGITETPTITPTISPTPTGQGGPDCENNPQLDICIEIDCPGDGECEVIIGGSPTPTVSPTQIPASPTPTTGGQGGTTSSSSNNSGSTGGVSATNTPVAKFANTGTFANTLSNIMLALGVIATSASAALYGKKKKATQK